MDKNLFSVLKLERKWICRAISRETKHFLRVVVYGMRTEGKRRLVFQINERLEM